MLKEHEKGFYNFKCIHCINDILISVGLPAVFKPEPVNNPKSVKIDLSKTCQICIFKNGMRKVTIPQKENSIFY